MTLIQLPATTTFELDAGGDIHFDDDVAIPADVYPGDAGVAFGPLFIATPPEGLVSIERLEFLPDADHERATPEDEDDDWFDFEFLDDEDGNETTGTATPAGIIAIGAAARRGQQPEPGGEADVRGRERPGDGYEVTRRAVLSLAACVLAGASMQPAVADSDDEPMQYLIAELEFREVSKPTIIRVADLVENVLPHSTEIYVDVDGAREADLEEPDQGALVPPETETARVYLEDGLGMLGRAQAWSRGVLAGSHDVEYHLELPQPLGQLEEGDEVVVSRHPAIVDPVREGGGSETILVVGPEADEVSVPHRDEEWGHDAGQYYIDDDQDALVLEVGPETPDSKQVTLRLAAGLVATTLDGAARSL